MSDPRVPAKSPLSADAASASRPDLVRDDPWWRLGYLTIAPLLRAFFRVRLHGLGHIPARGAAVIAPNHVSVLDPLMVALATSIRGRTVRFLAAAELFERGPHVVAWGLRRSGQIPVRRGMADRNALEEVASVIRAGSLGGVFPEGRMGEGTRLQRGHRGLARVALTAGVPIVPAAIWGTQRRWPRSGPRLTLPLRPRVTLVFGPPIEPVGDPRSRADVKELTDRVMREIQDLLALARLDAGG